MSRLLTAYHEAAHALVARSLGSPIESVSIDTRGGAMRGAPLPPEATTEEIVRGLVVVFAGDEAERYAPPDARAPERNGDPYFSAGEMDALALEPELEERPSDEDVIAHYIERIGPEAVEEARELAEELVYRKHRTGQLARLADELLWRSYLTGDDIERVLAT